MPNLEYNLYHFCATSAPDPAGRRSQGDRCSDIQNVKDWGAKGDASSNDTNAIQGAINYCANNHGGIVFFPPGEYRVSSISVGTNTLANAGNGIRLVGSGGAFQSTATILSAGYFGGTPLWTISKGTMTYDLLDGVEGLSTGNIQVTRNNVPIISCTVGGAISIDASQATGTYVAHCWIYGPGGTGGAAMGPGKGQGFGVAGSVGVVVSSGSLIECCRTTTGIFDIVFALSGNGANIIGCSDEVHNTGVRLGWGITSYSAGVPVLGEIPAYGCTIQGHQTEDNNVSYDLYNCDGCVVIGGFREGGDGVPHNPPGNVINGSYSGTTATLQTDIPHNIPAGTPSVLQLEFFNNNNWIPNIGTNPRGFISATVVDSTHFSYTLTPAPTGAAPTGNWNYPVAYGFRFRKVQNTLIVASANQTQPAIADFDLDYGGDVNAIQNNNVLMGMDALTAGFIPPRGANKAAWKYIQVPSAGTTVLVSDVTSLVQPFGVAANAARVAYPDGLMVFANLPGQSGVNQNGPFEGQEYTIIDSNTPSVSNWGATISSGGGSNHVKVRYDSSGTPGWRISG